MLPFKKNLSGKGPAFGLVLIVLFLFACLPFIDPAFAKEKESKSSGKKQKASLIVITKDLDGQPVAAPFYLDGDLQDKKQGQLTLSLSPNKYTVKFGALDGYSLKTPKKDTQKVVLKKGQSKQAIAVYSKNIAQGTASALKESKPFDIGGDKKGITASYETIDSNSLYFHGSKVTGKSSDVAHEAGLTDVSQITDASQYIFKSDSVGPVKKGELVIYHNTSTDSYGAIKVDDIHSSGGGLAAPYKAAGSTTIDITWYFLAKAEGETIDFSAADWEAPTTHASPDGGKLSKSWPVTLSCSDNSGGSGCAATYYTTDGKNPDFSSDVYTAPIPISGNVKLKFFSVDGYGNEEPVQSAAYSVASCSNARSQAACEVVEGCAWDDKKRKCSESQADSGATLCQTHATPATCETEGGCYWDYIAQDCYASLPCASFVSKLGCEADSNCAWNALTRICSEKNAALAEIAPGTICSDNITMAACFSVGCSWDYFANSCFDYTSQTPCSVKKTPAECSSAGCSWNKATDACSDSMSWGSPCFYYVTEPTCAGGGCYWDSSTSACSGYQEGGCSVYGTMATCNIMPGCMWDYATNVCISTFTGIKGGTAGGGGCSVYGTMETCNTMPGCWWDPVANACLGQTGGTAGGKCSAMITQPTCIAMPGCWWETAANVCFDATGGTTGGATGGTTGGAADGTSGGGCYANVTMATCNTMDGCWWDSAINACFGGATGGTTGGTTGGAAGGTSGGGCYANVTMATCNTMAGCWWDYAANKCFGDATGGTTGGTTGGAAGGATGCSTYITMPTCTTAGCFWDYATNTCSATQTGGSTGGTTGGTTGGATGGATGCSTYVTMATCTTGGCFWDYATNTCSATQTGGSTGGTTGGTTGGATGGATGCSTYVTMATCTTGGCFWDYATNTCSATQTGGSTGGTTGGTTGGATGCSTMITQPTCITMPGCTWDLVANKCY